MCLAYSSATPMASIVSLHGMNIDPFEQSWSVIVRIKSYPLDGGNFMMKSKAMHSNGCASGFVVMGNCGGLGRVVMFFHDWQSTQPLIYCVARFFILGHQ